MAQSEPKGAVQMPPVLVELFRSGLSASGEELRKINAWARSNARRILAGDFEIEGMAEELAVSEGEIYRALRLIGALLLKGEPLGSIDVDVYAVSLEANSELSAKARILLDGVRVESNEAEYAKQKGIVLSSVLPTLEGVGALSDLRAVFQELPSSSVTKSHRDGIAKLLGFEPLVVVNLELNDSSGNDSSCVFQVTEQSLRNMLRTFEDALVQLEVIKEHQKKSLVRS